MAVLADTSPLALPDVVAVGARAHLLVVGVERSSLYPRLQAAALAHPDCWSTPGHHLIDLWDLERDGPPLLTEALRALALKAAVLEATDSEDAAELAVAAPVEAAIHTVTAQLTVLGRIQGELRAVFVHATDRGRHDYDLGSYTDRAYIAAGWGEPNRRYWLGHEETVRRQSHLDDLYARIGIRDGGRSSRIRF